MSGTETRFVERTSGYPILTAPSLGHPGEISSTSGKEAPGDHALHHGTQKNQLRLVFWETTSGCNLECVHCRRIDVAAELARQDMTTEQGMAFIDSLAECAKPILVFGGGEPLYRKDIFALAKHAQSRGLTTALATNGTLIDDVTANKIVAAGFQRVAISIDGADP